MNYLRNFGILFIMGILVFGLAYMAFDNNGKLEKEYQETLQNACKVVKFTTIQEDTHPVCTIQCKWNHGNQGHATSTPVSCSDWHGKTVRRN